MQKERSRRVQKRLAGHKKEVDEEVTKKIRKKEEALGQEKWARDDEK